MPRLLFRLLFICFIMISSQIIFSQVTFSKPKKSKLTLAPIYYYPHIHVVPGGKSYEGLGGDLVFFSYLHTALEILKSPKDYEIYAEGYTFDLHSRGRYRLFNRDLRKVRRAFRRGFPRHISQWTQQQKEIFLKYGPVTVLYILKKIKRIRAADKWMSKSQRMRELKKCLQTKYISSVQKVYFDKFHTTWKEYYENLRVAQKGLSTKNCDHIISKREEFLVKRLKKHRKRSRKKLLIIYGLAHDFGKYFNDQITYLGNPALEYTAICYSFRYRYMHQTFKDFCSKYFLMLIDQMGHPEYFLNARFEKLKLRTNLFKALKNTRRPVNKHEKSCATASSTNTVKRVEACNALLQTVKSKKKKLKVKYSAQIHFWRAQAYQDLSKNKLAIKDYTKSLEQFPIAVELYPLYQKAFFERGEIYRKTGNYIQALKDYAKVLEINFQSAAAYNSRGIVYKKLKRYGDAIGEFRKAIQSNSRYYSAYYNLGEIYSGSKKYEKAIKNYTKVIQLNRKNVNAYETRARIYEVLGENNKAIKDYKKVLQIKPNSKISQAGLKRINAKLSE